MNISQPVPSAIAAVEFGFYTSDEIKALSVKQIQNPATFDTLLHPVPGGLYDPALGAWGDNSFVLLYTKIQIILLMFLIDARHVIFLPLPAPAMSAISNYQSLSITQHL